MKGRREKRGNEGGCIVSTRRWREEGERLDMQQREYKKEPKIG